MRYIAIAAIFLVALLLFIIPPVIDVGRKNHSVKNTVMNHNAFSTEYVFYTAYSKAEIDDTLSDRGEVEGVEYRYDKEQSLITLSYYGVERSYVLSLENSLDTDGNLLRVTQQELLPRGYLPYLVNTFFVQRLDAVPIAYQ